MTQPRLETLRCQPLAQSLQLFLHDTLVVGMQQLDNAKLEQLAFGPVENRGPGRIDRYGHQLRISDHHKVSR